MNIKEKAQTVLSQMQSFKSAGAIVIGLQPVSSPINEEEGKTLAVDILPDTISFISGTSKQGKVYATNKVSAVYNEKPTNISLSQRVIETLIDDEEVTQVFVTVIKNGEYKNFGLGYLTENESRDAYISLMEYRKTQMKKELATK